MKLSDFDKWDDNIAKQFCVYIQNRARTAPPAPISLPIEVTGVIRKRSLAPEECFVATGRVPNSLGDYHRLEAHAKITHPTILVNANDISRLLQQMADQLATDLLDQAYQKTISLSYQDVVSAYYAEYDREYKRVSMMPPISASVFSESGVLPSPQITFPTIDVDKLILPRLINNSVRVPEEKFRREYLGHPAPSAPPPSERLSQLQQLMNTGLIDKEKGRELVAEMFPPLPEKEDDKEDKRSAFEQALDSRKKKAFWGD